MMNNSPLKPLFWEDSADRSEAKHEFVNYRVIPDHDSFGKFAVRYKDSNSQPATGFATIEDAKAWAQDNYNGKMQPYIKPLPTWIDVNDRLPEQNTEVLVRYHAHFDDEEVKEFDFCTAFFYGKLFDVKDQHFYIRRTTKVTHWMPLPELPVSKESDCE